MWRMGGERREDGGVTVTCLFETYFVSELDISFDMIVSLSCVWEDSRKRKGCCWSWT